MHLASTPANLFVAGGKPYLRASVGYQIKLWDFFEEVGSTLIAFIQQAPIPSGETRWRAPAHAGFRYVGLSSNSTA
jgi:hypothetical protein